MIVFNSSLKVLAFSILMMFLGVCAVFAQDDIFSQGSDAKIPDMLPQDQQAVQNDASNDASNDGGDLSFDMGSSSEESAKPAPKPASETSASSSSVSVDTGAAAEKTGEPAKSEEPVKTKPEKKKRSFWSRLFGGRDKEESEEKKPDEVDKEIADILSQVEDDIKIANGESAQIDELSSDLNALEGDAALEGGNAKKAGLTPAQMLAVQEEVRRQAKEIEALKGLDSGYKLMQEGEYEDAVSAFQKALELLPKRPGTVEIRDKTKQSQAECEYRIADRKYRIGDYSRAIDACKRSLGYYSAHTRANRLLRRSESMYQKQLDEESRPKPPWKQAEYIDKEAGIREHLKKGRQYVSIDEFDKAKREFLDVLKLDNTNPEANRYLRQMYNKEYELFTEELDATKANMMARVRDTWNPPLPSERPPTPIEMGSSRTGTMDVNESRANLIKKLNDIILPELRFRSANIRDVVDYLTEASVENDPDPRRKGVNIMLMLDNDSSSPAPAPSSTEVPDDAFLFDETPSSPSGGGQVESGVPRITFSLQDISMMEAIKNICMLAKLKYRIEDNVVILYPANKAIGTIITRVYTVQPSIQDVILGAGDGGGGGGGGDDLFGSDFGGGGASVQKQDVKQFFIEAGVPFPEGTSIAYKPGVSKLFVSNTAENLERFESILRMLDQIPKQIEIEAKFMEVGQNDLEELGVEWLLTDNWEIMQQAGASAPIPIGGRERIQMNKNDVTRGLRYMAGGNVPSAMASGDMGSLLSISSVLTNPEMTFVLHMLDQKEGINLLSAPKVTTKSGMNAEIKIARELIYPTEFSKDINVLGTGEGNQEQTTVITPTAFETRDVGVILNVTPVVGPDGATIDLTMIPQVVELSEWINYGAYDPATGRTENMPQPIFHTRYIATSISIWDGQTVVMGGLITESQRTTEDKIPFLGDLPLIGALFRSKSSHSTKRNLLIFVTARIVDPAGNRIQQNDNNSRNNTSSN